MMHYVIIEKRGSSSLLLEKKATFQMWCKDSKQFKYISPKVLDVILKKAQNIFSYCLN
jgi:hypothetical protein